MAAQSYDEHYRAAWALVKRVMMTGANARQREAENEGAKQAIAHFRECLILEPRAWACMWGIGKAEQALGNHREALRYFEGAAAIETGNADIWREAAIAAGAIGEAQKAVQYGTAALKLRPTDAGLHANAAVAFLLAGDDDQAEQLATRALDLDPSDTMNKRVLELVKAVRSGTRERPSSL